jgi:hypothetical protein
MRREREPSDRRNNTQRLADQAPAAAVLVKDEALPVRDLREALKRIFRIK